MALIEMASVTIVTVVILAIIAIQDRWGASTAIFWVYGLYMLEVIGVFDGIAWVITGVLDFIIG